MEVEEHPRDATCSSSASAVVGEKRSEVAQKRVRCRGEAGEKFGDLVDLHKKDHLRLSQAASVQLRVPWRRKQGQVVRIGVEETKPEVAFSAFG